MVIVRMINGDALFANIDYKEFVSHCFEAPIVSTEITKRTPTGTERDLWKVASIVVRNISYFEHYEING